MHALEDFEQIGAENQDVDDLLGKYVRQQLCVALYAFLVDHLNQSNVWEVISKCAEAVGEKIQAEPQKEHR